MATTDSYKVAHAKMDTLEMDLYAKVLVIVYDINNMPVHITVDIDECSTGLNNCHDNADCNNTDGGFECHCKPGYVGDGFICIGECRDTLSLHA